MKKGNAKNALEVKKELATVLGESGKEHSLSKGRKLLVAGAILAVIGGGTAAALLLLSGNEQANSETVYREYAVTRGDVVLGLTESSSVSLTRETITFPVSSTVEEIYVKAGSSVKEGDPLLKMNSDEIAQSLKSYELQLEIMGLEVEQAKMQLDTKLLQAKQQLESSKEAGKLASDNKNVTIAALELALSKAQTSLANAQKQLGEYTNLSATFSSDYRRLNALEAQVDRLTDNVSSLQSTVNNTTDYADQRTTAEKELTSAWKLFAAAAVGLDADAAFTSPPVSGAAVALANEIGAYYSMSSVAPGTIYSGAGEDYQSAKQKISAWLAAAQSAGIQGVTITNLNTMLSALSNMETQAKKVRDYTQAASGSTSAAAAAKEELAAAQAELKSYQTAYDEFKEYYTKKYGTVTDAEELEDKIISLEAETEDAKIKLEQARLSVKTGTTSAEQKSETAATEAGNAKAQYELTEMELKQAVDAKQEKYDKLGDQIEDAKELLSADGTVYASCNGMVVSISVKAGDKVSVTFNDETKQISQYAQLLTLTNISDVYVPITISEEDILDVSIGQQASVTMSAFPNQTFDAQVDAISVETVRTGAATVSYAVTIKFLKENALDMYEGMSASITLVQRAARDVLYINSQAVTNTNGQATVLTKGADGKPVATNVKTGFTDGRNVEITSGLSEGDTVLMQSAVGGRA